jgi:hypothetical protein
VAGKTHPMNMQILVFKTDLRDRERIAAAEPHLKNLDGIIRWNVDLHDCDHVLRIETRELSPREVEWQLKQAGYFCEELPD